MGDGTLLVLWTVMVLQRITLLLFCSGIWDSVLIYFFAVYGLLKFKQSFKGDIVTPDDEGYLQAGSVDLQCGAQ